MFSYTVSIDSIEEDIKNGMEQIAGYLIMRFGVQKVWGPRL